MASEYQFPKADNDVLYDGDVNGMSNILAVEAGETIAAGNVVWIHLTTGEAWVSDADVHDKNRADGIAVTGGSDGNTVYVQTRGTWVTSGLTAKQDYYLSATAGAVSTTLGGVRIGFALSTTALNIQIRQDDRDAVGMIKAWHEDMTGMPSNMLTAFWYDCEGSAISDTESPFNGQNLPDLNTTSRFLRGDDTTGDTSGADTHSHSHSHALNDDGNTTATGTGKATRSSTDTDATAGSTLPAYFEVKWIMKVK